VIAVLTITVIVFVLVLFVSAYNWGYTHGQQQANEVNSKHGRQQANEATRTVNGFERDEQQAQRAIDYLYERARTQIDDLS